MNTEADSSIAADTTLVRALRERLQAQTGQPVALVQTHISWVLLAGPLAYKLKKPVRLSFVDFSTLAARKHFCEEEVRLNRRFSPSLYLGVEPVRGTRHAPSIGQGQGEPIDWVVCMRRFPDGALLQDLVMAGRLEGTQLDGLARRLADFHGTAPVAMPSTDFGTPDQATRAVAAVLSQLRAYCAAARIDTLQSWVDEQAQALRAVWLERQRSGAVRECHGDLHLANAVLVDGELLAFDCVEFDPTLRWIDVMNDVAFLTMDLKAHGRSDQAFRFLDVYLQTSGDYAGMQVLRFYEVYRALVRALVGCLRGGASDGATLSPGPDYLVCAEELVRSGGGTARLLITHGLSGSGKSTVAGQLLEAAGSVRIRSDVERKRLFGLSALQRAADQPVDLYTAEGSRRTFSRLAVCALAALQAGYPVIVDAAFLRRADRQAFRALAARLRLPFAILDCRASEAQLRSRVAARSVAADDASDADPSVLQSQLARQEPLDAGEQALALQVQTDKPIELAALCARWMAAAAEPDSPPASE